MKKIVLPGNGFVLRPFQQGDYAALAEKINDRDIYRFTLQIPYPYSKKDGKAFIKTVLQQYKKKAAEHFHLAIDINGELSGCVSLMNIEKGHKAEIGYWLAKEQWGKGIMSNAVSKMVSVGFRHFKLRKIYAYVFTNNKRSYSVLAKNGFKKEGLLIQHTKKAGKLMDEYILATIKK
ncbi:MAG: GNAT family protein [Patescibacteria group bacterium]